MWKTILIILASIAVIIFISVVLALFFTPKIRYQGCILLQDPQTKAVDCFGCTNNKCKDAPASYQIYQPTQIGIPYACQKSDQGCQLAQ
jgi:hypothetical protein